MSKKASESKNYKTLSPFLIAQEIKYDERVINFGALKKISEGQKTLFSAFPKVLLQEQNLFQASI